MTPVTPRLSVSQLLSVPDTQSGFSDVPDQQELAEIVPGGKGFPL